MKSNLGNELKEHIPFTGIAVIAAVLLTFGLSFFTNYRYSEEVFEVFHVLHVLLSAFATTLVFHKYDKSIWKALLIGIVGSIIIGTLSDVIFPYLGSAIFGLAPHLHFPIAEHPLLIIGVSLIGVLCGMKFKKTGFPHLFHVFISVFASLFYLISFVSMSAIWAWLVAILITFISVLIPCCISDIILPLIFIKKKKKN